MGDVLAITEMRLILPTLLQKFTFERTSSDPIQESPGFVMGMDQVMEMKITKRKES